MDRWSKGRVALVGDAGYCCSPLSGQGTSVALLGAYILAGELAAAGDDYEKGFTSYQAEFQDYVKRNQWLVVDNIPGGAPIPQEVLPHSPLDHPQGLLTGQWGRRSVPAFMVPAFIVKRGLRLCSLARKLAVIPPCVHIQSRERLTPRPELTGNVRIGAGR